MPTTSRQQFTRCAENEHLVSCGRQENSGDEGGRGKGGRTRADLSNNDWGGGVRH